MTTTQVLDDTSIYARLDVQGMRHALAGLADQCREAWAAGQAWPIPPSLSRGGRPPGRIVIVGMGGSAIGAEVVSAIAGRLSTVPVTVVRGYAPPPTDADALVIASSHSGETEETLEAFQRSLDGPSMHLAMSTGGRLARLSESLGYDLFRYEYPSSPRAALGWGVFPVLAILQRLGALPLEAEIVEAACAELDQCALDWGLDVPLEANAAKQIAMALHGRVPIIIGSEMLEAAARRWAGQMSENAKQWAVHVALPEMNHNLIVGLESPPVAREALHVLFLDSLAVHDRTRLRIKLTAEAMDRAAIPHHELMIGGTHPIDSIMRACYLGDWVSLYLAMLNEVDPTPVPAVDQLKRDLNSHSR